MVKRQTRRPPKPEGIEPMPRSRRSKEPKLFDMEEALSPLKDLAALGGFLNSEYDDATIVISAASTFDHFLSVFIMMHIGGKPPKKAVGALFKPTAPLSTFSAKIDLCFLMGHLTANMKHDLDLIRLIRNRFCHSTSRVTFDDDEVGKLCAGFKYYIGPEQLNAYSVSLIDTLKAHGILDNRLRFTTASMMLVVMLISHLFVKNAQLEHVVAHRAEISMKAIRDSHAFLDHVADRLRSTLELASQRLPQGENAPSKSQEAPTHPPPASQG